MINVGSLIRRYIAVIPAVVVSCLALPFRYTTTLSEPDLVRMMAAMIYGEASSGYEYAGQHYGIQFSFGYYRLLYWMAPAGLLRSPQATAELINGVGILFGILAVWSCAGYLSALLGKTVGIVTSLFVFASPMMLPVVFSGHPLLAAAASLFVAGLMFVAADSSATALQRASLNSIALVMLVVGLMMRAEIVVAFPFLLATSVPRAWDRIDEWAPVGWRVLLLGCSFAVFLFMQRPFVGVSGGATNVLVSYLQTAKSLGSVGRALGVLVLGTGLAASLGLIAAIVWLAGNRSRFRWEIWLILSLLLPTLALWLPDPQPARHLFFAMLALDILLALAMVNWQSSPIKLIACLLAVILGNQVFAEALHPILAANYHWTHPSIVQRRSAQRTPMGAFPLDQRGNQALQAHLSEEASRLAQLSPKHLLFFGDWPHYVVAHMVAQDPSLRWTERNINGINVIELRSEDRDIVLVEKYSARPRDVQAEMLEDTQWASWPVYVQPSTRTQFDRIPVPADRLIPLDLHKGLVNDGAMSTSGAATPSRGRFQGVGTRGLEQG